MDTYSRWALIRGCALIRINTVIKIQKDINGDLPNRDWVVKVVFPIQILLIFGRCNRHFLDIRLNIFLFYALSVAAKILFPKKQFSSLKNVNHLTNNCQRSIRVLVSSSRKRKQKKRLSELPPSHAALKKRKNITRRH